MIVDVTNHIGKFNAYSDEGVFRLFYYLAPQRTWSFFNLSSLQDFQREFPVISRLMEKGEIVHAFLELNRLAEKRDDITAEGDMFQDLSSYPSLLAFYAD